MKFLKNIFLLFLLSALIPDGSSAQVGFHSDYDTITKARDFGRNASLLKYKRLGISMEMGVGVSGSKSGYGTYTYVAPFLNYRVSPKFRLDVGAMYMQGFNNFNTNELQNFNSNMSTLSVFARGNYLASDKLLISGAVYKTFDLNKPQASDLLGQKRSFENYGIMVGAEYKITENLTIGAQLNFSNHHTNYNPLYPQDNYFGELQPGYRSNNPFSNDRYHSGFMGW